MAAAHVRFAVYDETITTHMKLNAMEKSCPAKVTGICTRMPVTPVKAVYVVNTMFLRNDRKTCFTAETSLDLGPVINGGT